jgi:hypothetical protein
VRLRVDAGKGPLLAVAVPTFTVALAMLWVVIGIITVLNWRSVVPIELPIALPPGLAGLLMFGVPIALTVLLFWLTRKTRLDALPMLPLAESFTRGVREAAAMPRIADYRQAPRRRSDDEEAEAEAAAAAEEDRLHRQRPSRRRE